MLHRLPYLYLLLLSSVISPRIVSGQVDSSVYLQVRKAIDMGKSKYAPDKRTKVIELVFMDVPQNRYTIQTTESAARSFLQEQLNGSPAKIQYQLLPDNSVSNSQQGVVNLSVANLRTRPGHDAEMATQVLLGTQVDLLQVLRGEYRVRTPEGYIAWVPTSSVTAMTVQEMQNWSNKRKLIFTADYGKSLSLPAENSLRVSDLVYGNILALEGESDSFYTVSYPDGRSAYIPRDQATDFDIWLKTRSLTAENILTSAKTMLGLPYLWGGTSVKGVDCSGFTKTTFFMNGVIIPRDASQQVLAGDKVDILDNEGHFDEQKALKNLHPGDLLFFAAGKNSGTHARVTHVAVYMGNGEFIHAAGTVRINSMLQHADHYDDFQTRTIVAARRYIGSGDKQIQKINDSTFYN